MNDEKMRIINKFKNKNLKEKLQQNHVDLLVSSEVKPRDISRKITLIYIILSGLWITFSDKLIAVIFTDVHIVTKVSTFKGWMFVVVTATLLYFLIMRDLERIKYWGNEIVAIYEELEVAYEELAATEEEMRVNYKELQKSEERYRLAIEGAKDAIWEWNIEKEEFFISDKFYHALGYKPNGKKLKELIEEVIHEDDKERVFEEMWEYLRGNGEFYESEFRTKSITGEYIWIYNKGKALRDSEGKAKIVSGSLTDITHRKKYEEDMMHMAYYDLLTDIPNRSFLMERLKEVLEKGDSKGALIFLDLDDFKKINDTLGHNYGDELLKVIAKKLKEVLDESAILARMSGDEFIILVSETVDKFSLNDLGEKIVSIFKNPTEIGQTHVYTTASLGITLFPQDGEEANKLLKNCDAAMYYAKSKGKNNFAFFNKKMTDEITRRIEIEKELRNAIKENEFQIVYQPQVDLKSEKIKYLEALIRWNNKKFGRVSPGEFIPIAEETGLIVEIGEWIIKEVCNQNKLWIEKGFHYEGVSINVSAVQLENAHFLRNIEHIVNEVGIDARFIELEITENVLLNDVDSKIVLFEELKALGFKIALDDFGTGYSSLNYLKILPINTLKIDKCFTDNVCHNNIDRYIIESTVNLAHNMDISVVIEGVEQEAQVNILRELNSDIIQGYYYYKPMDANEIESIFL